MNLSVKEKSTPRHREQTCSCQGKWGGEGMDWELEISKCELVDIGF